MDRLAHSQEKDGENSHRGELAPLEAHIVRMQEKMGSAHLLDAGEDGERTPIGWIDFVKSLLDEIISRMRLIEIIVGLNHH